jgi:hypothetical protein
LEAIDQIRSAFNTLKLYSGIPDTESITNYYDYMQENPVKIDPEVERLKEEEKRRRKEKGEIEDLVQEEK